MTLIIKDVAGVKYTAGNKVIELQGGCYLNIVSDDDYKLLKQNQAFTKALDKGFIIESSNQSKAVDEAKQNLFDKQDTSIKANETANKVSLKKD